MLQEVEPTALNRALVALQLQGRLTEAQERFARQTVRYRYTDFCVPVITFGPRPNYMLEMRFEECIYVYCWGPALHFEGYSFSYPSQIRTTRAFHGTGKAEGFPSDVYSSNVPVEILERHLSAISDKRTTKIKTHHFRNGAPLLEGVAHG